MCGGWSLEIGNAFRGSVVRHDRIEQPSSWLASVNAAYLGEYLDRASAMARAEAESEQRMELTLYDWEVYQAGKGQRRPDRAGQSDAAAIGR